MKSHDVLDELHHSFPYSACSNSHLVQHEQHNSHCCHIYHTIVIRLANSAPQASSVTAAAGLRTNVAELPKLTGDEDVTKDAGSEDEDEADAEEN